MAWHSPLVVRCTLLLSATWLYAGPSIAQTHAFRSVDIRMPAAVPSETLFIRYCLTGQFGEYCTWEQPKPNLLAYAISAVHDGKPAATVKAVLYAPGCEMETLEFTVLALNDLQYTFTCRPLSALSLTGVVVQTDRFYGRKVELRARYLAYWAQTFFGVNEGIVTSIPIGDSAELTEDSHFTLTLPNFSKDSLAGLSDHPGALQLWARDKDTGDPIALLVPSAHTTSGQRSHLGGLRIEPVYPAGLIFTPCVANAVQVHDHNGFAIRPDPRDACDQ